MVFFDWNTYSLLSLRIAVKVEYEVKHHIVRQGASPRFGTPLRIDTIINARQLVKEVKALNLCYQSSLPQRLADGSIEYKVIRVERRTSVTSATVHDGIKRERCTKHRQRITCIKPIVIIPCRELIEVAHFAR